MGNHAGIVREKHELIQGINKLDAIKSKIDTLKANPTSQYNPGWNLAIDLKNLHIVSSAVTKSALEREESRGGHTRLDFPDERSDLMDFNVVVKKDNDGNMIVERKTKVTPPDDLYSIAHSTLKELEEND